MNRHDALRVYIAAGDDAVLAAWCMVVREYRMPAASDISPYDAWDAYQELFGHGLITTTAYDSTDIKRAFFSGRRPFAHEIQEVLDNVLFLCPDHQPEEPMKPKIPANPFASNGAAIATREGGALSRGPQSSSLPAPSVGAPISPFSRESLPQSKAPALPNMMPNRTTAAVPFRQNAGLPCIEQDGNELRPQIFCGGCGEQLRIEADGSQGIEMDDLPEGNISVLEAIWFSVCRSCNVVYHVSAGRADVPHDAFR